VVRIVTGVTAVLLALALGACASKPAAVEKPAPAPSAPSAPAAAPAVAAPDRELADARVLRARIVRFKLDQQYPQDFAAADARLTEGQAQMNKDNAAAKASIDAASAGYSKILKDGLTPMVRRGRQDVETVRASATGIKAQVAVTDDYAAAEAVYQKALASDNAGDQEAAIDGYGQARDQFVKVYDAAKAKKDRAERSMQDARKNLSDAEARAKTAEDAQKAEGVR